MLNNHLNQLGSIFSLTNKSLITQEPLNVWWKYIHLIVLLGFVLRILVAVFSDHIYHADEVFQYLEQGHRLAYGYGIIPWEYRFGIRSWIIPGFVASLLYVFHNLGFSDPNIYVPLIRIIFSLLSLSLIYAVYIVGRNLFTEQIGRLSAIFIAIWYEIVYFAHKPSPEVLAAYLLIWAVACLVVKPRLVSVIGLGVLSALVIALRLQYLPAIAVLGLVALFKFQSSNILKALGAFIVTVILIGWFEYLTWGSIYASYYNNFILNYVYDVASIFGRNRITYYAKELILASSGILCILSFIGLIRLPRNLLLIACAGAIIAAHTLISHKEYRFIFAVIPLLLIVSASVIWELVLNSSFLKLKLRNYYFILGIFSLVSLIGYIGYLPFQPSHYKGPIWIKEDANNAFLYLHNEPDLASIFVESPYWSSTGGYYYLHRNVPIYLPRHINELEKQNLSIEDVVTHIVCNKNYAHQKEFKTVAEFGELHVRRSIKNSKNITQTEIDTYNRKRKHVDGVIPPTVQLKPLQKWVK